MLRAVWSGAGRYHHWLFFSLLLLARVASGTASVSPAVALPPPTDPVALGIQAIVKEGSHPKLRWSHFSDVRAPLQKFYQDRNFQPVWLRKGVPSAAASEVAEALSNAESQGLRNEDYDGETLRTWLSQIRGDTDPQEIALLDTALSVSAMRYGSSLFAGRVNPRNVDYGLSLEPKQLDLAEFLSRLVSSRHPAREFDGLAPKLRLYQNLQAALARYRDLAGRDKTVELGFPAKLEPGAAHADVPKLRRLLASFGELTAEEASSGSEVYDPTTVEAIKRFQQRHGLSADGVIGKGTLARLRLPNAARLRQIQLGMERLRWLPKQVDSSYIMVNIPSFDLFGFTDGFGSGKPDLQMKVIVGEAVDGRRTPVFHSDMTYVVFRPHWNLPYKIAVKEMLPGALRNPGYLARHNIEIVSGFGPSSPVYASSRENLQLVSSGQLKLRQKPGPKNALGLVKFAFPNTNNVYLHSTPNQGLFGRDRRDFSHGCIRVADPVRLAEWVLRDEGEWSRPRIERAMNGKEPKLVTLKHPLPVYIFYSTVLADESGKIMFFDDIYGHDRILQSLLDKGFPYPG